MPPQYTFSFVFEFSDGKCTYRRLATTPDAEAESFVMFANTAANRKALFMDLFGVPVLPANLSFSMLRLPKFPGTPLTAKKTKSLAKKYFSIPVEFRLYYPVPP